MLLKALFRGDSLQCLCRLERDFLINILYFVSFLLVCTFVYD